ncbi:hypothetical protein BUQ74_06370 [Leptospira weilii serovar Heyan]|nr:hypothetical protein BUQ74_06370 [Leptospira weilii serovar Heyan]
MKRKASQFPKFMRGTKDYAPLSLVHFALYGSRKIELNFALYGSRKIELNFALYGSRNRSGASFTMKFASCDDDP